MPTGLAESFRDRIRRLLDGEFSDSLTDQLADEIVQWAIQKSLEGHDRPDVKLDYRWHDAHGVPYASTTHDLFELANTVDGARWELGTLVDQLLSARAVIARVLWLQTHMWSHFQRLMDADSRVERDDEPTTLVWW